MVISSFPMLCFSTATLQVLACLFNHAAMLGYLTVCARLSLSGPTHATDITLHSCKATMLSIMNQLLLSKDLRALQGHHKMDSLLYMVVLMYGSPLQVREWLDEPCFQVGDLVVFNIVVGNAELPSRGSSSLLYRTWGISQLKLIFQLLPSQLQLRRCWGPMIYPHVNLLLQVM